MKLLLKKAEGSIALITVLVVSSILLISGLTIVLSSVDYSKSVKNISKVVDSGPIIDSCFEESMYKIKLNKNITGPFTITVDSLSCNANIQNDAGDPNIKVITISTTIDGNSFQRTRKVNVSSNIFTVIE